VIAGSSAVRLNQPLVDVVLPVLNEEDALPWVLERMPPGYHAIVVDNGSSDGSAAIARQLGAEVVTEPRPGFGSACHAGLTSATRPIVAFMDADASLDPQQLPMVVEPIERNRADLVLGARCGEPGAWPFVPRVANHVLCWELRRRGGPHLSDLGPMRAAGREALLALDIRDRRFGWPLEMVVKAAASGWRVEEADVVYRCRTGRSKVTGTVRGTARTVRDMVRVLR